MLTARKASPRQAARRNCPCPPLHRFPFPRRAPRSLRDRARYGIRPAPGSSWPSKGNIPEILVSVGGDACGPGQITLLFDPDIKPDSGRKLLQGELPEGI